MLFDLRSRRRKTAVRITYVFLALVLGGGLILVGVGTGNGVGGLLNAFTNNGSGGSSNDPQAAKDVKAAVRATTLNPSSPAAWTQLMNARLEQAQSNGNYNSTTGVYSAAGKAALSKGVDAWSHYLTLTHHKPGLTATELAKSFYEGLGNYTGTASAFQYIIGLEPKLVGAYTCLAYSAYAAGDTQLGNPAAAKAVKLTTKLQQLTLKTTLQAARKSPDTAKEYIAAGDC